MIDSVGKQKLLLKQGFYTVWWERNVYVRLLNYIMYWLAFCRTNTVVIPVVNTTTGLCSCNSQPLSIG